MDSFENAASGKREEIKNLIAKVLGAASQTALGTDGVTPVQPVTPTLPQGLAGGNLAPQEQHDSGINLLQEGNDPESTARDWIISKESSGKTTAKNPNSSAFGLGQLIKANREAYGKRLGIDPDTTDYNEQLKLMDAYVKERYGSYRKAQEFWQQHNWY